MTHLTASVLTPEVARDVVLGDWSAGGRRGGGRA